MALACIEPNLVAHSSLVTTDVGATLFIFLSIVSSLGGSLIVRPGGFWPVVGDFHRHGVDRQIFSNSSPRDSSFRSFSRSPLDRRQLLSLPCPTAREQKSNLQAASRLERIFASYTVFVLLVISSCCIFFKALNRGFRISAIFYLGPRRHAGFFLRGIFLSRLVDLFRRLFSYQDTDRHLALIIGSLVLFPPGQPLGRRDACSFATVAFYLCCHGPSEGQYRPAPYSSRLSFSVALGLSLGDGGEPICRMFARTHILSSARLCFLRLFPLFGSLPISLLTLTNSAEVRTKGIDT